MDKAIKEAISKLTYSTTIGKDPINPSYYSKEATKVVKDMPYFLGAAVKYIVRAGKKDPSKYEEDLRKAMRCIEIHLERDEH